ncbi:uncharacterized protein LOC129729182 [Wyeomyia smithii]|uniref:uncharacterized protein LOC129729182 n=1 Tax=Wyeomyia smithii TaxID=174621 RepID=UPI002467FAFD|nr:uncharacterized protein LOC129729182 [Wyeomyia smithii]
MPRYKDTNSSTDNKEGQATDQGAADATSKSTVCSNVAYGKPTNVLLATAVILVEDDMGSRYPARAILDSGHWSVCGKSEAAGTSNNQISSFIVQQTIEFFGVTKGDGRFTHNISSHNEMGVPRSRTRQVMVVAYVEKMFRQIKVDPADAPLQSILWRFDSREIETYELTTVTYGTKPAPFLATRTLKQLAQDERERYPLAAQAISEDVYMDDVISGADSLEAAYELRNQFNGLMASGGFLLRKSASNCSEVLKDIPQDNLALPNSEEIFWDQDETVKTLDLSWLPKTDKFKFQFNLPAIKPDEILTKRKILSTIASLFDPVGLLGATITVAKITLQRLWCLQDEHGNRLDWDAPVPFMVGEEWREYHKRLASLNDLRISRCVIIPGARAIEIHCFCDASEKAYGACMYIRSTDNQGKTSVCLFTAKSKVAPLRVQSLPRLELCGASLAAQMYEKAAEALNGSYRVYFWTDSTCVLTWINAIPTTWTTFVANKVAKIQRITENQTWNHVPGSCNPADLISRGIQPDTIHSNKLWWEGPGWLKEGVESWPLQDPTVKVTDVPEKRRSTVACTTVEEKSFSVWFISKFSSYTTMIRSAAYWRRLLVALHTKDKVENEFLSTEELKQAELVIVKHVQQETFHKEIAALATGKQIHRSSPLRWFNPIITEAGILRVGGRLNFSDVAYSTKHPIILPAKHVLTEIIMRHYHQINNDTLERQHLFAEIIGQQTYSACETSGENILKYQTV